MQRLRGNLQAAEDAGDNRGAQIERERLEVALSRIRFQRARDLGRRPKLKSIAALPAALVYSGGTNPP
jgi:hypothetical protein